MNRKILIFRNTPIDVDIKMYEYFAEYLWQGNVVVYAETSFKSCRKICGFQENAAGIQTIIIDKTDIAFDDAFFLLNKNEIFIFYGIPMAKKYLPFIKKYYIAYAIISERDTSFYDNNTFKIIIKKAFPFIQYIRNSYLFHYLKCYIAMGRAGVKCYNRYYCIPSKILYDFMYNDGNVPLAPKLIHENDKVKFVYVGRFDYKFKGVDTLLAAFKNVYGKFSLDLIGGYGIDADDAKEKVKKINNAKYLEACDKDKLCEVLNEYDVIIVPSRLDGWNLHCNLAINAGLGIISTDQAGSEELVEQCGNGVVIPAGDVQALRAAVQRVIDNPLIVNEWKEKTMGYAKKISYQTAAKYLFDILKYSFDNSEKTKKPVCPWML